MLCLCWGYGSWNWESSNLGWRLLQEWNLNLKFLQKVSGRSGLSRIRSGFLLKVDQIWKIRWGMVRESIRVWVWSGLLDSWGWEMRNQKVHTRISDLSEMKSCMNYGGWQEFVKGIIISDGWLTWKGIGMVWVVPTYSLRGMEWLKVAEGEILQWLNLWWRWFPFYSRIMIKSYAFVPKWCNT